MSPTHVSRSAEKLVLGSPYGKVPCRQVKLAAVIAGKEERAWARGFGLALAEMIRLGSEGAVEEVMRNAGMTVGRLRMAGLLDFDLRAIKGVVTRSLGGSR